MGGYTKDVEAGEFRQWLALNRAAWNSTSHSADSGVIYVDLFHDKADYLLYSLHIGRLIGQITQKKVVGLTGHVGCVPASCANFDIEDVRMIASAFGVEVIEFAPVARVGKAIEWLNTLARTNGISLAELSEATLRRCLLEAQDDDGFPIGRYIYETYLRANLLETVNEVDALMVQAVAVCLDLDARFQEQFKILTPAWLVIGHIDYSPWGIAAHRALMSSAQLAYFRTEGHVRIHLVRDVPPRGTTLCGHIRRGQRAFINDQINDAISRSSTQSDDCFMSAATGTRFRSHRIVPQPLPVPSPSGWDRFRETVHRRLELPQGKPVVGIYSITFSDIPHTDEQLFDDNYQWLFETLTYARSRPDIVWLVKVHPSDLVYNNTRAMARLRDQFERPGHIIFVVDEWSSAAMFLACDLVTTLRGSPGLQAAALGIPVVFAGHGQFSDCGFGILPTTQMAYFEALGSAAFRNEPNEVHTARARGYYFVENMVLANVSTYLGVFGELMGAPDKIWAKLVERLRWYDWRKDPLGLALSAAIRQSQPRVSPELLDPAMHLAEGKELPAVRGSDLLSLFSGGELIPLYGFHALENWGTWTNGTPAAVLIRIRQPVDGRFSVAFRMGTKLPGDWIPPRFKSVTIDGVPATASDRAGEGEFVFEAGPAHFGQGGYVLVEFMSEGGTVPSAAGSWSDERLLVFPISELLWHWSS